MVRSRAALFLLVVVAAVLPFGPVVAHRRLLTSRGSDRRLFKAHGRWCGPKWTGGVRISAAQYMREGRSFNARCIDSADCACRQHDYDCAIHGGCCKEDDTKLINALKGTKHPWISRAMRVARNFHKKCKKRSKFFRFLSLSQYSEEDEGRLVDVVPMSSPYALKDDRDFSAAAAHAPVGPFRDRRLIKAHGRWCGPNWTGGLRISSAQYLREGRSFNARCIDSADCACRQHDYDCAIHGGCCKEDDTKLINALQGTNSPFLIASMKAARVFHKSCSKSSSWWDEDEDIHPRRRMPLVWPSDIPLEVDVVPAGERRLGVSVPRHPDDPTLCRFPGGNCYQLRLQKVSGCTNGAYKIHGLWPQWASKCYSSPAKIVSNEFSRTLLAEMKKNWPTCKPWGNEGFWTHEWNKHGTCSDTKSIADFFSSTIHLAKKYRHLCSSNGPNGPMIFRKRHSHNEDALECGICFNRALTKIIDCAGGVRGISI